jgi:tRNA (adenine-N(1)-)-methyltransferase non-catalytic subunit
MAEIEALKQNSTGSGRELIEKIMQSHTALDQKTSFSLAKYTLRKHKKFMKRFTVLPLDVASLVDWMFADRDFGKILEMRNEAVGLIGCWANVHAAGEDAALLANVGSSSRYLLVDDTGGLLVAAMAERMGILHQTNFEAEPAASADEVASDADDRQLPMAGEPRRPDGKRHPTAMSALSNTITLVHANQQPNIGLLRYLNFDSNNPTVSHPLYTHLKTVSWLQLLDPEGDTTYQEPVLIPDQEVAKMKSNRRSAYYRKRRRWERVKSVVDETRAGGFNGLVVASLTDPTSILRHLVPLLAGGSQVVVYSPNVEPLVELADYYSKARRTAFINTAAEKRSAPSKDFPVDPTMLLGTTVQTARVRRWQVLPGRTHPLMTGRGGAEGYIFSGTRVIPAEGKVEARGRPPRGKKARAESSEVEGQKTTEQELIDSAKDESALSPLKRQKFEEQIGSVTGEGVEAPFKKQRVEENNEFEAQLAAERGFIDNARPERGQSPLEMETVEELVVQEAEEDEMPVLGPATEALKEKEGVEDDVQMSIEP